MPLIDILLATYKGARYLPDLLGSLAVQTEPDWRLIVRDDGSDDESLAVIETWAKEGGHRVVILSDGARLGAKGSFGRLLEASDAPYFMFCDQDDVWLPEKIESLLHEVRAAEKARPTGFPILVHSDLRVVAADLTELGPSFWATQRFRFTAVEGQKEVGLARSLVVQNIVTGCATLGNAALRDLATPIPDASVMHDWWVALVAGMFGEIRSLKEPTILYRQHGSNTIGARDWGPVDVFRRAVSQPASAVARTRTWLEESRKQAKAFAERFGDRLDPATHDTLLAYASLGERSFLERKAFLLRSGVWPQSPTRSAIMLAIL